MQADWDETFFDAEREDPSIYWVCFRTGDDGDSGALHDPQRITGAAAVEEVLAGVREERGERRSELFVETVGRGEIRADGRTERSEGVSDGAPDP